MGKENWIRPYIRQYRTFFVLSIFLGLLTILFGGALMFTSGYLISKSAARPESILMVYVPIVGVRAFGIGRAVLSYVERLSGHSLVLKILSEMRVKLYKVIEPQAFFVRSRFRTGDILGVLANDIEHIQDFYLKTFIPAFVSLIIYAIIVVCSGLFSIPFAIFLAIMIGLLLFVGPLFSLTFTKSKNEHLKKNRNELYYKFTDGIFGISDWILSGHSSQLIEKVKKQEHQIFQIEEKKQSFINWRDVANQLVLGFIVIGVIYWANDFTLKELLTPPFIAAFGLAALSLMESFLPIAGAVSDITTYQDSLKRLDTIESKALLITEENHTADDVELFSNCDKLIEINKLTFGYSPDLPVLNEVNLTVSQGEKIAIIGRSGTGKSTLLHLLHGAIHPTSGEVKINGRNITSLSGSITKYISVLNQKSYLFNTSVLNNIRLGNPAASDDDVIRVAKMVQLDELIKQLPLGYDTLMEETGQRFSGGERQRIALARILLQNTPIVILDEPTVGLDPITESKLLSTIFTTLKDKTIIWVTHHLIGVEQVDRVLFLDQGKFVMEGSHKQLLESEERYRRLYSLDRPFY